MPSARIAKVRRRAPTIDAFGQMPVEARHRLFRANSASRAARRLIARDILPEIRERLKFLHEVGLGYLQLGRGVPTLSGGEAQRIRLAAQLGSNLSGVLYILDEPTIGLHARDNEQLLAALDKLKARGNSVLVVEHDEATMRRADYIIDLGPGAGCAWRRGGGRGHAGRIAAAPGLDHRPSACGRIGSSRAGGSGGRSGRPSLKAEGRRSKAEEVRSPKPKAAGRR